MPAVNRLTSNKEEIEKIKLKVLEILELTPEKNFIILQLFDKEVEKQQQLIALEDEIKKNFSTGNWTYFKNKKNNINMDRPYLNLIRAICKECNIKYENKNTTMKIDGNQIPIRKYIFNL
jgi:hypothetical protein